MWKIHTRTYIYILMVNKHQMNSDTKKISWILLCRKMGPSHVQLFLLLSFVASTSFRVGRSLSEDQSDPLGHKLFC